MDRILDFNEKVEWVLEQHKSTNHMYDTYLPYEFHLRMVVNVYNRFKHILESNVEYGTRDNIVNPVLQASISHVVLLACWGHDLIEDTRVSYNDVKKALGEGAADIIYAVTNEKGKNRKERANDKYYEGIRNTPGAVFVKLCDRIANVQYSKMTGSRMFEMYKKENVEFTKSLGIRGDGVEYPGHEFFALYLQLLQLFEKT
jgi:(p)ppGpp synthase/HD superfamily hydrolase